MLEPLPCDNCYAFLGSCSPRLFPSGLPSSLVPTQWSCHAWIGMLFRRCTAVKSAPVLRLEQGMGLSRSGALCVFNPTMFLFFPIPFLLQWNWNRRGEGWGKLTPLANLFLHHHLALAVTETQGFLPCPCLWEALGHIFLLSASKIMGHEAGEISNNRPEAALAKDRFLFKTPLMGPQMSQRQVAQQSPRPSGPVGHFLWRNNIK